MFRIFLFLPFTLLLVDSKAQLPTLFDSIYKLSFERIELEVDVDSLLEFKLTDTEHQGLMMVKSENSELIRLPVKVSVRSKSRRRHCDFPPLKLNFVKGDLEKMGLDREDEFKIVTHCLEDRDGENGLIKEYLLYELYRIITPVSLRVKLFDIVYINKRSGNHEKQKAMILESEKEFAKTHQSKLCDCMGSVADSIESLQFEILSMFQYMIGNDDMDHRVERNIKLLVPDNGGLRIPFAYDFDFSAIVNAPYVHPQIKDNALIRRKYLGFQQNQSRLPEVMELFQSKRKEIFDFIKNFKLISSAERRRCIEYIEAFYQDVEARNLQFEYKEY